jgi:hypothetical protein
MVLALKDLVGLSCLSSVGKFEIHDHIQTLAMGKIAQAHSSLLLLGVVVENLGMCFKVY